MLMQRNVIFHNPRCSKSRQTLHFLEERNVDIEVVEYLKTPPSKEELQFICSRLDKRPIELMRVKENLFKELGLSIEDPRSDEEWIDILCKNPALIERPIVVYNQKVALGRPPEDVLEII